MTSRTSDNVHSNLLSWFDFHGGHWASIILPPVRLKIISGSSSEIFSDERLMFSSAYLRHNHSDGTHHGDGNDYIAARCGSMRCRPTKMAGWHVSHDGWPHPRAMAAAQTMTMAGGNNYMALRVAWCRLMKMAAATVPTNMAALAASPLMAQSRGLRKAPNLRIESFRASVHPFT
jgi:hypothetical protein